MRKVFAYSYVGLSAGVVFFHVAAILGAPVGAFTQGGQVSGALEREGRIAATFSILLILIFVLIALALLRHAPGVPKSGWLRVGQVLLVAQSAIAVVLNFITPSLSERLVWGPVTTVMLACVVGLVLSGRTREKSK